MNVSLVAQDLLLDRVELGVQLLAGERPLPVYIVAREVRAIVAAHHSIHIHHRDHLYCELLPQLLHLHSVGQQSPDHSFHDE